MFEKSSPVPGCVSPFQRDEIKMLIGYAKHIVTEKCCKNKCQCPLLQHLTFEEICRDTDNTTASASIKIASDDLLNRIALNSFKPTS
jgi:hypothetical protein